MTPRINRRRYQELVAFLKETIRDTRSSQKVRMLAAARLDGIYERTERAEEQAAARAERVAARALDAQQQQGPAIAPQEQPSQDAEVDDDDRIKAVFANILKTGATDVG